MNMLISYSFLYIFIHQLPLREDVKERERERETMVCLTIPELYPLISLVRIRGSGYDIDAKPTLLDLARVSPLSASVRIGRLPPAFSRLFHRHQEETTITTTTINNNSNSSSNSSSSNGGIDVNKLSSTQHGLDAGILSLRKTNALISTTTTTTTATSTATTASTTSGISNSSKRRRSSDSSDDEISSPPAPKKCCIIQRSQHQQSPVLILKGIVVKNTATQQQPQQQLQRQLLVNLLLETKRLKRDNEILKNRVNVIQDVFRDKLKLKFLVESISS